MSSSKENKKRRGSYCFICGFIDGDRFGFFAVNKKRLSEWEKLIPKPGLKIGSPICGRHFDIDDIIKGREIGGIFFSFKKWSLKDLAVPKHLLCNICCKLGDHPAKSLDSSQVKKGILRNNPKCKTTDSSFHQMDKDPYINMDFPINQVIPGKESVTVNQADSASLSPTEFVATNVCCRPMDEPDEEQTINVAEHPSVSGDSMTYANEPSVPNVPSTSFDFGSLSRVIKLPSNWRWDIVDQSCYTTILSGKEFVHKIVFITDMLLTFFINGREVIFPFLKHDRIWKLIDLQRALYEFDTLHPCPGMLDRSLCSSSCRNVKNSHGTELRSLICKSVCNKDEKQCPNCRVHEGKLHYLKTAQSRRVASLTKRLKTNQKRVQRFILHGKIGALTVNNLRRSIHTMSANPISKKMKRLPMPPHSPAAVSVQYTACAAQSILLQQAHPHFKLMTCSATAVNSCCHGNKNL
ncbi:uncharacterized protein LOC124206121 isoform X3 [Daphnia pulex]|uniref:uncharacterized protein LOC124206121 isoform X3 n=1 Tax=Daphnia pulex TaxID=6669 RepID=UPI001EDD6471|nr:uncharacterized protein LOC124206121 isoform X3 [Daphnia pulex]